MPGTRRKGDVWRPQEDRLIAAHYRTKTAPELAELLPNRTPTAIAQRARILGVLKYQKVPRKGAPA